MTNCAFPSWRLAALALMIKLNSSLQEVNGFAVAGIQERTGCRITSLHATNNLIEIDDSNFRDLFRGDQYVLVDCCAKWCA